MDEIMTTETGVHAIDLAYNGINGCTIDSIFGCK